MTTYELSFDAHLVYKAILLVPATSIAIFVANCLYKYLINYQKVILAENEHCQEPQKKHNIKAISDQIKSHKLVRGLDYTKRTVIYEIFDKLPNRYNAFCQVSFLTDHHSFYLINDLDLIKSIRNEELYSDLFTSQLIQPYLVLDSKCNLKIKKNEYDKIVKPLIRSYVQTSLNSFVNDKMTEIFELFLFNNTKLSQKNIFELVFKISTSYIKTVYNIESNQKEELTSGEKLILYNLFEIHQTFTVGLFTNNSSEIVEAYSNCYTEFMRLIEEEFELDLEEDNIESNELDRDSSQIKFLIIKSIYLDSLKIYSCLTWFLHEFAVDSSVDVETLKENSSNCESTNELEAFNARYFKENLLKSFLKTLSLDLFYVNSNREIPAKFSFLSRRDILIALNLFNVVKSMEIDGDLSENFNLIDEYIQTVADSLGFFFLKNFELNELNVESCNVDNESYDLPIIRYFDE